MATGEVFVSKADYTGNAVKLVVWCRPLVAFTHHNIRVNIGLPVSFEQQARSSSRRLFAGTVAGCSFRPFAV